MSNVLPADAKEQVWGMYQARFILVGSLVLLLAAAFSALALAPSYTVLALQERSVAPKQASAATQEDRAAIAHTQALIGALSPLVATSSAGALVAEALRVRPAGIAVTHITASAGQPGTIVLSGSATHIDAISTYQSALQHDPVFSAVSVPVGDLAGTADGTFSITLSAHF